jgi:hypothetical protein
MPRAHSQEVRMRKIEAMIQPHKLDDVQAEIDGKIFVLPVEDAVRIRTGERSDAVIGSTEADDDVASGYDAPSLPGFSIGR